MTSKSARLKLVCIMSGHSSLSYMSFIDLISGHIVVEKKRRRYILFEPSWTLRRFLVEESKDTKSQNSTDAQCLEESQIVAADFFQEIILFSLDDERERKNERAGGSIARRNERLRKSTKTAR